MTTNRIPYQFTIAALARWEREHEKLSERWDDAKTDEDVKQLRSLEDRLLRRVQYAFYTDTKTINSLNRCQKMSIDQIRQIAIK